MQTYVCKKVEYTINKQKGFTGVNKKEALKSMKQEKKKKQRHEINRICQQYLYSFFVVVTTIMRLSFFTMWHPCVSTPHIVAAASTPWCCWRVYQKCGHRACAEVDGNDESFSCKGLFHVSCLLLSFEPNMLVIGIRQVCKSNMISTVQDQHHFQSCWF